MSDRNSIGLESVPTPTNLPPPVPPEAMLVNQRLTNRPYSTCLARRKSSSNAQVSVISMTSVLFSTSEMRACLIVSRDLLHSPTYMRCTYAHVHACTHLHGLCEHSGTLLHVNYGRKLWTVGKYVFVFLLCRQRLWDGNYLAGIQEPISI